jgi:hypothetical protein
MRYFQLLMILICGSLTCLFCVVTAFHFCVLVEQLEGYASYREMVTTGIKIVAFSTLTSYFQGRVDLLSLK